MYHVHEEPHRFGRSGWLRPAVMGANDGIVSTASLVIGVAAAGVDKSSVILAGVAALVAGAASMAAGEYVSVSSQADIEASDLEIERSALAQHYDAEKQELAAIYQARGVAKALALQVAEQLMAHDALGAHARDEIGITEISRARPFKAALASACAFTTGAALPVIAVLLTTPGTTVLVVAIASLLALALAGVASAQVSGSSRWRSAARVTGWGCMAMLLTAVAGRLVGTAV